MRLGPPSEFVRRQRSRRKMIGETKFRGDMHEARHPVRGAHLYQLGMRRSRAGYGR